MRRGQILYVFRISHWRRALRNPSSICSRDEPVLTFPGGGTEWEPIWLLAGACGGQGRAAAAAKMNSLPRGRAGDIGRDARHTVCFIHVNGNSCEQNRKNS